MLIAIVEDRFFLSKEIQLGVILVPLRIYDLPNHTVVAAGTASPPAGPAKPPLGQQGPKGRRAQVCRDPTVPASRRCDQAGDSGQGSERGDVHDGGCWSFRPDCAGQRREQVRL